MFLVAVEEKRREERREKRVREPEGEGPSVSFSFSVRSLFLPEEEPLCRSSSPFVVVLGRVRVREFLRARARAD